MDQQSEQAASLIQRSERIVALTGAGISVPSGIPDFRSSSGLWASENPMLVASVEGFARDPRQFYRWIGPLLDHVLMAKPNPAHYAFAELEWRGQLRGVITQNIDGLHQKAGSHEVFELHGHLRSATCVACGQRVPSEPLIPQVRQGDVPRCSCGGAFKPDIVLFGDSLPMGLYWLALEALRQCDLLIVAGTSLEVAPVSEMPLEVLGRGAKVIQINKSPTYLDTSATITLAGDVAEILPRLVRRAGAMG